MNEEVGCGCAVLIILALLKLWAIYYLVNDVIIELANGHHIGVGKIIWSIILVAFVFSKIKLNFNNKKK